MRALSRPDLLKASATPYNLSWTAAALIEELLKEREALKQEIFHSLHCALPGNVISFDPETQTAAIQPAVRLGSLPYPVLTDVPVFMPVPFEVNPGDACLVIFSDVDIDSW